MVKDLEEQNMIRKQITRSAEKICVQMDGTVQIYIVQEPTVYSEMIAIVGMSP